ncbi:MAG: hypothetical protein IIY02_02790 [Firmicutes bacterium]|nr:hypothetical protein [Bacillota bacterium]
MAAICTLTAMVLWGMLLGLGYQVFSLISERCRRLFATVMWYVFGGAVCFLATALFLFFVNGGEWGLYGFLFTVLGFYWYHHSFWSKGKRFSAGAFRVAAATCGGVRRGAGRLYGLFAFPFGKVVDKGVAWRSKRTSKNKVENEADGDPM